MADSVAHICKPLLDNFIGSPPVYKIPAYKLPKYVCIYSSIITYLTLIHKKSSALFRTGLQLSLESLINYSKLILLYNIVSSINTVKYSNINKVQTHEKVIRVSKPYLNQKNICELLLKAIV